MHDKEVKIDFENLGAIQAEIDYLEENSPDKRKKKEFKEYLERFNYLCGLYNKLSGERVFQIKI